MKRIVAFFDTFDEVPDNAKYLFSRKLEIPIEETEEQKANRIISGVQDENLNSPAILYMHYYEVDSMDFEELIETGFGKKSALDKMNDYILKYVPKEKI